MNDLMQFALALLTGLLLGGVFFGGLWWTVQQGLASPRPALWFGFSFIVRTSIVLYGFYWVGASNWQHLLLCLLGFMSARFMIVRLTAPTPSEEANHAP
ncbi:MAG: ATP synthase subunit I [Gallionellaceae bacterium]|jgi:F1F0 ATPase subunit 2